MSSSCDARIYYAVFYDMITSGNRVAAFCKAALAKSGEYKAKTRGLIIIDKRRFTRGSSQRHHQWAA